VLLSLSGWFRSSVSLPALVYISCFLVQDTTNLKGTCLLLLNQSFKNSRSHDVLSYLRLPFLFLGVFGVKEVFATSYETKVTQRSGFLNPSAMAFLISIMYLFFCISITFPPLPDDHTHNSNYRHFHERMPWSSSLHLLFYSFVCTFHPPYDGIVYVLPQYLMNYWDTTWMNITSGRGHHLCIVFGVIERTDHNS
jgi:hypothetical protein